MKVMAIIYLAIITAWFVNAYKFSECDFKLTDESDLKCELIHGIGIFGFAPVTVWFDTDED